MQQGNHEMKSLTVTLGLCLLFCLLPVVFVTGQSCPRGSPHPMITCGRGRSNQRCPNGYYCSSGHTGRFGLCCPRIVPGACTRGRPVSGKECRNGRGCSYGSTCTRNIGSGMAICCPDNHTYQG